MKLHFNYTNLIQYIKAKPVSDFYMRHNYPSKYVTCLDIFVSTEFNMYYITLLCLTIYNQLNNDVLKKLDNEKLHKDKSFLMYKIMFLIMFVIIWVCGYIWYGYIILYYM